MKSRNAYRPSHVDPPGATVQDYLDVLEISARELARRCGRSPSSSQRSFPGKPLWNRRPPCSSRTS